MNPASPTPQNSPGEIAAPAVWVALGSVLVAFGLSPTKASAVAGMAAVLTPYVVKLALWMRRKG